MGARATLLPIALLLLAAAVEAQDVTTTASVPLASPTGSGTRNLAFGVVAPIAGTTQNVDVAAAVAPASGTVQSGEFRFDVSGARGLSFTVLVPAQLTTAGAAPLSASFNGTQYGGFCVSATAVCTLTAFNPGVAPVVLVCAQTLGSGVCHPTRTFGAGNQLRVYIGGRLQVPPTARAGVYTGTVTLTIVQVY